MRDEEATLVATEDAVLTWRGEGVTLMDVVVAAVVPRAGKEILEDEEMAL